ncbi:MAG: Xaa-Pro peptidase family protein [Treponemataceae bacterium]|nr:Xaa-Pro peptidase family protein [Treponemataceae bacterium]
MPKISVYQKRRAALATWMAQNSIGLVIIEDSENMRDPALRYFCGHPSDGVLGICVTGDAVLSPWDEHLAARKADADVIIPFTKFDRSPVQAAAGIGAILQVPANTRIEVPSRTSYPQFLRYIEAFSKNDVLCRENGVNQQIKRMRATKDDTEIDTIRKACKLTDEVINAIEEGLTAGKFTTESEIALFVEKAAHDNGCEGTGFGTLSAGPARSFYIHAFPGYTSGEFGTQGLSILDFGLIYDGYTSDVTLTIARGTLEKKQNEMLETVQTVANQALALYKADIPVCEANRKADSIFQQINREMPHALGHGVGLEAHEWPSVRSSADVSQVFAPGMVVTLEPGLYDAKLGGCRLENDVLITETGNELLTNSRIIRL